jgi:hypothetical protein
VRIAGGPVLDARPRNPVAVADNMLQFAEFTPRRREGGADSLPACNLALRRRDFQDLGGFPEIPLASGEDVLFCQFAAARWPGGLRFIPGMRVRHLGRSTLDALCRHHRAFGVTRAALGLKVLPRHLRWGRWAAMIVPIACRRMQILLAATARHDPGRLVLAIALAPILLAGFASWAVGFREGCRLNRGAGA